MKENFPQQATQEQDVEGRSKFAFSNGLSLPVTTDLASGLAAGDNSLSRYQGPRVNSSIENAIPHAGYSTQYSLNSSNKSTLKIPRHPDYIEFNDRLRTYARWIHRNPDPTTLCKAGFFYTDDGDLVRCFQCGIGLKDFSDGDDPFKEHVIHSGNCHYLIEMFGESKLAEFKRHFQAHDPEYNRQMQWNERHKISAVPYNYRHPEYQTLEARLATFTSWPAQMMQRPEQLADAGLYYTGFEDQVRCFACDGGLRRWDPEDDPWTEHCRWFPACPFAKERKGDEYIALVQAAVACENERQLQAQDPEYNRQMQWNERHNISAVPYNYRHPEYQTLEARLATFTSWPAQMMQRPEQLADAGLYYTGFEDHVRCFACNGGLRRWDPEDDPWTEHCRWFPACPFAKERKGDEYIALVQAAVAFENEDSESAQSRGQDRLGAMEKMTFRDLDLRAAQNEQKDACLEMGYQIPDFNEAVQELRNRGTIKPTIEEIIDVIEDIKERKLQERAIHARQNETLVEEKQRLNSYIICMPYHQNSMNALFLPCTHHRMCFECAERVTRCPVRERYIRQNIRTYLV